MAVTLTSVSADMAEAMLRWMLDPAVAENVGVQTDPTLEKTRSWIAAAAESGIHARAILADGHHVGNVVLDQMDPHTRAARLSMYVGDPEMRGRGVGRSALNLLLTEAFNDLHLNKVWLLVHARNEPALALYLATGFVMEGLLRDEFRLGNELIPVWRMGILEKDWRAAQPGDS
jgi:RimJ/RimL family protein N-acetyltransferase